MPEKWDHIIELFNAALERAPAERPDFLRQACAQDEWVRAEVESLLSSYDESFLEKSPTTKILSRAVDSMIGKQLGAYRILQPSGEGGMAVVYLAERADHEYRKRVAIKMVKPGANNGEILRRFRNERQTLAALDHPNIVKLLDGGSTDDGLPYLVMDYVEGVPIDQYCDTRRLPIPDRLQLFRAVCSVVHYAHENLVIHRDLKPSNILIAADGAPRLLDFGIAKLLNPQCFQTQLVTLGDWRPMTPEYASPEQVRGEPLTSASDVYSLGVLLYQLLTGRLPYLTTRQSLSAIERKICEDEPEKPSVAVGNTGERGTEQDGPPLTADDVSHARNTTPQDLRSALEGDLDAIVLMALCKEPQRRYASAAQFADDIERSLSGQPVRARRSTAIYRGRKFLGRHKEALATVLVALALMTALGMWQLRRVSRQSATTAPSSLQTTTRSSLALLGFKNLSGRADTAWVSTALSEMLTTDLGAGEQLRTISGETVARSKIDLSLPDEVSLAPDTLHRLRKNLSSDYVVLGSYLDMGKDSGGQVRLDLRVQDTANGETVASVSEAGTEAQLFEMVSRAGARVREQLGVAQVSATDSAGIKASLPANPEAMRLYSLGLTKLRSFDALGARDLLVRAVAADPAYPLTHSALAKAWASLGYDANALREAKQALDLGAGLSRENRLLIQARHYEADGKWDNAVETYRALFSFFPDNIEYGLDLANAQVSAGRGKDALTTLAALEQVNGAKDDPRVDIGVADAAASLADNQLRRDAAERAAEKANKQGARLLLARARSTGCRALANLGENQTATAECEQARRIFQEAGDRANLARTLHNVAEVPLNQGNYLEAEKLYSEELSLARQTGDKRGVGRALVNLGVIYKTQGDLTRALQTYDEALRNDREIGDKNALPIVMGNRANVLRKQGKLREALQQYRESLALSEEIGNKSSIALAMDNIGGMLFEQGDLGGAYKMYQQSLALHREIGQKRYYALTLVDAGQLFQQRGNFTEAAKQFNEALALQQQLGEAGSIAETHMALADLNCQYSNAAEAESNARTALPYFQSQKDSADEMLTLASLSCALRQQGKLDEAQREMARALTLAASSKDVSYRLPVEIQNAYTHIASRDFSGAEAVARDAISEATKRGFVQWQLEATLALGASEMKHNPAVGRSRLQHLEKIARAKGFELIAHKAATAMN